jgi:SSS family solute:Na+ symporter
MVANLLPIGIRGLLAATMLSALMSTIAGALNSAATVCCYDIYRQVRPDATDKATVTMGRIVTFTAMVLAIVWAPFIENFESILQANTNMLAYIAPSITAVFVWGVFWKKASNTGALWCLASGVIIGPLLFFLDLFRTKEGLQDFLLFRLYNEIHMGFLMHSFFLFIVCSAILVVGSHLRPQEHTEESASLVWSNPMAIFKRRGWSGFGNYKFLALLLLAVTILVYVIF